MRFVYISLFSVLFFWLCATSLLAQSVTVKLAANPLFFGTIYVPMSVRAAVEVGVSRKSSVQFTTGFWGYKETGEGSEFGPKFYLDYRWYPKAKEIRNAGFYLSPFIGYSRLRAYDSDLQIGYSRRIVETQAGFLLGYQPFKRGRLSLDLHLGPTYQWRDWATEYADGRSQFIALNRVWMRGGFMVAYRFKARNETEEKK